VGIPDISQDKKGIADTNNKCDAVEGEGDDAGVGDESKNPVMTLPTKKRINTELFIDRKQRFI